MQLQFSAHEIVGQFRLAGAPGGLQFNLLPRTGPPLGSDQVAQGFIQSGLENVQGWRGHRLSGPYFHSWTTPTWKELLLIPCLHLSGFNLCLLPLMLPPHTTMRTLALSSQSIPCASWGTAHIGLSKPVSSPHKPLPADPVLQPTNIMIPLYWTHSSLSASFLDWGSGGGQTRCRI